MTRLSITLLYIYRPSLPKLSWNGYRLSHGPFLLFRWYKFSLLSKTPAPVCGQSSSVRPDSLTSASNAPQPTLLVHVGSVSFSRCNCTIAGHCRAFQRLAHRALFCLFPCLQSRDQSQGCNKWAKSSGLWKKPAKVECKTAGSFRDPIALEKLFHSPDQILQRVHSTLIKSFACHGKQPPNVAP